MYINFASFFSSVVVLFYLNSSAGQVWFSYIVRSEDTKFDGALLIQKGHQCSLLREREGEIYSRMQSWVDYV